MPMIVDRIEGELARVELSQGSFEDVPLSSIDGRVRDGAVLLAGEDGRYVVDEDETAKRNESIKERARSLFRKRS